MRRRIAFYVPRTNYLKVLAPVVLHLLRHCAAEFEVLILFPGWAIRKTALQPREEDFQRIFGSQVALRRLPEVEAFLQLIRGGSLDAVINMTARVYDIEPAALEALRAASRQRGVKWMAVPYLFTQDYFIAENPRAVADTWDCIGTLGPASLTYLESHLRQADPPLAHVLRSRVTVMGFPELDALAESVDAQAIRRRYGLPLDRPIVYLSTAPVVYPLVNASWRSRGVERRFRGETDGFFGDLAGRIASLGDRQVVSYRRYVQAVRRCADANGACVVAKTRAKHRDPAYLRQYVDVLIDDTSYYPFTTLELLRVSDLYAGFYSASVMEAVAAGVYAITFLFVPVEIAEPQPLAQAWANIFHRNPGSLWNAPGVSAMIDGTSPSAGEALERLANGRLQDFRIDPAARERLLDRFVGYRGASAARIANVLRGLWAELPADAAMPGAVNA